MGKILIILSICFGSVSWGWHNLGHRTVASIAFSRLSPKAQKAVTAILQNEKFNDVSTWADDIKGTPGWEQAGYYHFVSLPNGTTYFQNLSKLSVPMQNKGDLIMATMKSVYTLRSSSSSLQVKNWALKFLVHFVGDLHQPLHTGKKEDMSGNLIRVMWFGKPVSLHQLWDGIIVATAYANQLSKIDPAQQDKWYANYLVNKYPQLMNRKCDIDIEGWFNQALSIQPVAYVGYDGNNVSYLKKSLPYIETQMLNSGMDLACILNTIVANPNQLTVREVQLINNLNKTLNRNFLNIINLTQTRND